MVRLGREGGKEKIRYKGLCDSQSYVLCSRIADHRICYYIMGGEGGGRCDFLRIFAFGLNVLRLYHDFKLKRGV